MKKITLLYLFLLSSLFFHCNKQKEVIINNNTAPIDNTISTIKINDYINKLYILLLGREPSSTELQQDYTALRQGNVSTTTRKDLITSITTKNGYHYHLFEIAGANILNGSDTASIRYRYQSLIDNITPNASQQEIDIAYVSINKLKAVYNIPAHLQNNQITMVECHKQLTDNELYDAINMNAVNFVTSTFTNFCNRNPTIYELENGVTMCQNSQEGVLFLETGYKKQDYINIFFRNNPYYEGQIFQLYKAYLNRIPTSDESNYLMNLYKNTSNYTTIQQYILSSDEYFSH